MVLFVMLFQKDGVCFEEALLVSGVVYMPQSVALFVCPLKQEFCGPLQCAEFFAGTAQLVRSWRSRGYAAKGFDLERPLAVSFSAREAFFLSSCDSNFAGSQLHDLSTPVGVAVSFVAVMMLEAGAWCHAGVVCSSFCWINRATHQRSMFFPDGDGSRAHVVLGNTLAGASVALVLLAWARGSIVTVENPKNSELVHSRPMQYLIEFFSDRCSQLGVQLCHQLRQYTINLGDFGAETLKPVWLYAAEDLDEALTSTCRFQDRPPSSSSSSQPVTHTFLGYDCCLARRLKERREIVHFC